MPRYSFAPSVPYFMNLAKTIVKIIIYKYNIKKHFNYMFFNIKSLIINEMKLNDNQVNLPPKPYFNRLLKAIISCSFS